MTAKSRPDRGSEADAKTRRPLQIDLPQWATRITDRELDYEVHRALLRQATARGYGAHRDKSCAAFIRRARHALATARDELRTVSVRRHAASRADDWFSRAESCARGVDEVIAEIDLVKRGSRLIPADWHRLVAFDAIFPVRGAKRYSSVTCHIQLLGSERRITVQLRKGDNDNSRAFRVFRAATMRRLRRRGYERIFKEPNYEYFIRGVTRATDVVREIRQLDAMFGPAVAHKWGKW